MKWDSANAQLVNSVINDNGTDVTINGNLNVAGTTTTLDSTVMRIADPIIELRKEQVYQVLMVASKSIEQHNLTVKF